MNFINYRPTCQLVFVGQRNKKAAVDWISGESVVYKNCIKDFGGKIFVNVVSCKIKTAILKLISGSKF
jgi:hypothetical protein